MCVGVELIIAESWSLCVGVELMTACVNCWAGVDDCECVGEELMTVRWGGVGDVCCWSW